MFYIRQHKTFSQLIRILNTIFKCFTSHASKNCSTSFDTKLVHQHACIFVICDETMYLCESIIYDCWMSCTRNKMHKIYLVCKNIVMVDKWLSWWIFVWTKCIIMKERKTGSVAIWIFRYIKSFHKDAYETKPRERNVALLSTPHRSH